MKTLLNPNAKESRFEKVENPIELYLYWNAEEGKLKTSSEFETQEKMSFVLLDIIYKISQRDQHAPHAEQVFSQYYSSVHDEVLFFNKDKEGKYKQVFKGAYSKQDTKDFCKINRLSNQMCLIVATRKGKDEDFVLGMITLSGNAFGAFIDYKKEVGSLQENPGLLFDGFFEIPNTRKKGEVLKMPLIKKAVVKEESIKSILEITPPLVKWMENQVAGRKKEEKEDGSEDLPEGFEDSAINADIEI